LKREILGKFKKVKAKP